ncbi:2-keto-4-pentenoate hydratase [Pseudaquabacterium pictum]|uniref:Hydratase n=1 Tax=Pseudaquabacterium pictum TaxID=2315236 RepID=A0A480AIE3_9BURK|nr:hydratase [Rubrivivax pictus]GCL61203.1 hydratase [Rubrivivax pictus]
MAPATAAQAAALLWQHRQAGSKLTALPAGLRPADADAGHAIQAQLPVVAGDAVAGWKIAATSSAGQVHIGVGGPLAGRLLAATVAGDGASWSLTGNGMRVAEPEFVFRFGADLPPRGEPYTVDDVLTAVAALHTGIEVPDSRFTDFVTAGEAQLLADDACAHQFVLGPATAADWRALDLSRHAVQATVDQAGGQQLLREGSGAAVLGDPRLALAWLVNDLRQRGLGLAAGQFVTTGTCMPPLAIAPGDRVWADFGLLGRVSAAFTA